MKLVFLLFILNGCGEAEFSSSVASGDNALSGDTTGDTSGDATGTKTETNQQTLQIHTPVIDTTSATITALKSSQTPLDILLVIDNSSSMKRVNEIMRENFSSLIPDPVANSQQIGANPWRIAITTSTVEECLWTVMDKEERGIAGHADEFLKVLKSLEHFNTRPIDLEQGRTFTTRTYAQQRNTFFEQTAKMATRALASELAVWNRTAATREECAGPAESWLRKKSLLAVILVSDEDADDNTQPGDSRCGGTDNTDCLKKLWNEIAKVRVPGRTAEAYAMLHPRNNDVNVAGDPTGSTIYRRWHNRQSDGSFAIAPLHLWKCGTPCSSYGLELADIAAGLQKISTRIQQQTRLSYYLPDDSDEDIDRVYLLDGTNKQLLEPDGYHIENGVLTLTTTPPTSAIGIEIHR